MDVDIDPFPHLQFNAEGVISVNFYKYATGWTERPNELESTLCRHLNREGIENDVGIDYMGLLDNRLHSVLTVLRNAVCYPAPETEYPKDAEGLITQIIYFTRFNPKDVIELSNEVCEMVHIIEKLELTSSCLSASHDYAKYFFGDVFKLEGVNIDRVLEVFATCITRVGLANRQILKASFKAGFSDLEVRDTMIGIIESNIVYNVTYETTDSSGEVYRAIKNMELPIAQYILYLYTGRPCDISTMTIDNPLTFNLIGADKATKECASQCMNAYNKLAELRTHYNRDIAVDASQQNYVTTEGLYTYTLRLNNLIDYILQDAGSRTIIPISELEDIRTIGSILGCPPMTVKSEAEIVQYIREFGAKILHKPITENDSFNLHDTVMHELQRKDSQIHYFTTVFNEANNKCEDIETSHRLQSETISKCIDKLNASLATNNKRPNRRQTRETDIECIVNLACEEIRELYNSNVKLRDDASHQTARANKANDNSYQKLLSANRANKSLTTEVGVLKKQKAASDERAAIEFNALKAENDRLNATIRSLSEELAVLRTESGISKESIASNQEQINAFQRATSLLEGQVRDLSTQYSSLLESYNGANTELNQTKESYAGLKATHESCVTANRDLVDELGQLREKSNQQIVSLQTRLDHTLQKCEASEKKRDEFANQLEYTIANNQSVNDTNGVLRENLKKKSDEYNTVYNELVEKCTKLNEVEAKLQHSNTVNTTKIQELCDKTIAMKSLDEKYELLRTTTDDTIVKLREELGSTKSTLTVKTNELSEIRRQYAEQRDKFAEQQGIHDKISSDWRSQFETLKTKNKLLSDEIDGLKSTHDNKIGTVSRELETVQAELMQYREKCGDAEGEVIRLRSELQDVSKYRGLYEKSESGFKVLTESYNELSIELETTKVQASNSKTELQKSRERSANLTSTLVTVKEELSKSQTELNATQDRSKQLYSDLETTKKQKMKSDTELQKCRNSSKDLESALDKSRKRLEKLDGELADAKYKLTAERNKCKTLTDQATKSRSDYEQLNDRYSELEYELSTANDTLTQLRTNLLDHETRFVQKEQELISAISQLNHKDTDYQAIAKTLGDTTKTLQKSRNEASELKVELQTTKDKLTTTTNSMREMDAKLKTLQNAIVENTESSSLTKATLADNAKHIAMLQSGLNEVTESSNRLKMEKKQLQDDNDKLLVQIKTLEKQIDKLQKEKAKCEETIARSMVDIEVRDNTLKKQNGEHLAKFDELQKQCGIKLADIQQKYNTSQESVATLNQQIAQRNEQFNELVKERDALNTQLMNIQEQLCTSKERNDTYDETVSRLNGDIAQRNEHIRDLNQRIVGLEHQVVELDNNMRIRNEAAEAATANTSVEIGSLMADVQKLNREKDVLQEQLREYASECERLGGKVTEFEQLEARCNELDRELAEVREVAAQREQENSEYAETVSRLNGDIAQQNEHIRGLEREADNRTIEMDQASDSITNDINSYKAKLSEYEQQIGTLKERIVGLESQVVELDNTLHIRNEAAKAATANTSVEIGSLMADVQKLNREKDVLQEQLREYASECERLGGKVTEFEQLEARCNELDRELAEVREVVAQREQCIEQLDTKRAEDSNKDEQRLAEFSSQTEHLSSRIRSLTSIFIKVYGDCCEIHRLICELNRDILGAQFDIFNHIEPMTHDQLENCYDIDQITNDVISTSGRMLTKVTRITEALKAKEEETHGGLIHISNQCGFHITSELTVPEVMSRVVKIFSAIRPYNPNDVKCDSVKTYCELVRTAVVEYTDEIDDIIYKVGLINSQLSTLTKLVASVKS